MKNSVEIGQRYRRKCGALFEVYSVGETDHYGLCIEESHDSSFRRGQRYSGRRFEDISLYKLEMKIHNFKTLYEKLL